MPDIALYYPYTHIPDEAWLKAAALYLPRLGLIAPAGYPRRPSRTADVLHAELDFLVDVDPAGRTEAVAPEFLQLLNREGDALRARYAWPSHFPDECARSCIMTVTLAAGLNMQPFTEWNGCTSVKSSPN